MLLNCYYGCLFNWILNFKFYQNKFYISDVLDDIVISALGEIFKETEHCDKDVDQGVQDMHAHHC